MFFTYQINNKLSLYGDEGFILIPKNRRNKICFNFKHFPKLRWGPLLV